MVDHFASRRSVRIICLACFLVILAMLAAACGSAAPSGGAAPTAAGAAGAAPGGDITVGLITKTETNPFFVKMKEGAQAKANELGAKLLTGAGAKDGDNEGQVTALENMVNAGAKGILITPSDTKAIVPSIKKARDKGVVVIALDTATEPQDAVDALFATNNFNAGLLIGQWAKAAMGGKTPVIATLDLQPGITVGAQRHNGFLQGYRPGQGGPELVRPRDRSRSGLRPGHPWRPDRRPDRHGELPEQEP